MPRPPSRTRARPVRDAQASWASAVSERWAALVISTRPSMVMSALPSPRCRSSSRPSGVATLSMVRQGNTGAFFTRGAAPGGGKHQPASLARLGRAGGLDPAAHLGRGSQAGLLVHHLAALEDHEVGDAADVV